MKNNLLPSLVMLLAGLVCSIISLRQGVDLMSFTTRLLTVLVVFYIIGAILKVILSCAFKAMEDRQKKAEYCLKVLCLARLMIPKSLIMMMTMISQLASCRIIYW